jgi:hypothetical protein
MYVFMPHSVCKILQIPNKTDRSTFAHRWGIVKVHIYRCKAILTHRIYEVNAGNGHPTHKCIYANALHKLHIRADTPARSRKKDSTGSL